MRRGTTPTLSIELEDFDMDLVKTPYITVKQDYVNITKVAEVEENTLSISLTEQDTLRFHPGTMQAQVKILMIDNSVMATEITEYSVEDILNETILNVPEEEDDTDGDESGV